MTCPNYTPLWEWVLEDKELSLLEAAIICRVLSWNEKNLECFESNQTLANHFNTDRSTIKRAIRRLSDSGWLASLYPRKRDRILFINPEKLRPGPLFTEDLTGYPQWGQNAPGVGVKCTPNGGKMPPYQDISRDISRGIVRTLSQNLFKTPRTTMSKTQFERRRTELIEKLLERERK